MNVRVEFDASRVENKINNVIKQAQVLLKNEVAKGSDKYVPFLNGILAKSVNASINTTDNQLVYNTPYARYLYYGFVMSGRAPKQVTSKALQYTKTHHSQASPQWFEVWKSAGGEVATQKVKDYFHEKLKG